MVIIPRRNEVVKGVGISIQPQPPFMSRSKLDNIIRSALWTSYNFSCFYCSESLDWSDLNIDHIIPEWLDNDQKKLNEIKKDLELSENFDVHSHANLVPVHARCNQRKGQGLFSKSTSLFYFSITNRHLEKIEEELIKLKTRKNKGQILSKVHSAIATDLIGVDELQKILQKAKTDNWSSTQVKLPEGVEFVDEVYELFYLNTDCKALYSKKLLLPGSTQPLQLTNKGGQTVLVSTLIEWKQAIDQGYRPRTTANLRIAASFDFLEGLVDALHTAKMPKASFLSEPWIELDKLDYLSPVILFCLDPLHKEISEGLSVGDLVRQGRVKVNSNSRYNISLEHDGMEMSLLEQFRADFDGDGIEDIFAKGWMRQVGGTFGFGFTTILTRLSEKHLMQPIKGLSKRTITI